MPTSPLHIVSGRIENHGAPSPLEGTRLDVEGVTDVVTSPGATCGMQCWEDPEDAGNGEGCASPPPRKLGCRFQNKEGDQIMSLKENRQQMAERTFLKMVKEEKETLAFCPCEAEGDQRKTSWTGGQGGVF